MNHSLLSLILQDEKVTNVLNDLRKSATEGKSFRIPDEDMMHMKHKFQEGIELGEKGLHELSFQVVKAMASVAHAKATLIVWGRCPDLHHPEILKSYTNIDLNQVMTAKYMDTMIAWTHSPVCKMCKKKANTIASFNQYKFEEEFPSGLEVLLSRIKTTSNVCYKIADMVFDIDRMFSRDKIVNTYTQTLTDMYGLKMAFYDKENIYHAIDYFKNSEDMTILAEKDYMGVNRKKSGYEAYKIVLQRNSQLFEIQLQTSQMLDTERSSLNANHQTYKERQMEERQKLGDDYWNLYDILIQMFAGRADDEHQNIRKT